MIGTRCYKFPTQALNLISLFDNGNEDLKILQAPGCVSCNLIRATMQFVSDINLTLADEFEKYDLGHYFVDFLNK